MAKKIKKIIGIFFTVAGVVFGIIICAFLAFGKWLEIETNTINKNLYK